MEHSRLQINQIHKYAVRINHYSGVQQKKIGELEQFTNKTFLKHTVLIQKDANINVEDINRSI